MQHQFPKLPAAPLQLQLPFPAQHQRNSSNQPQLPALLLTRRLLSPITTTTTPLLPYRVHHLAPRQRLRTMSLFGSQQQAHLLSLQNTPTTRETGTYTNTCTTRFIRGDTTRTAIKPPNYIPSSPSTSSSPLLLGYRIIATSVGLLGAGSLSQAFHTSRGWIALRFVSANSNNLEGGQHFPHHLCHELDAIVFPLAPSKLVT